MYLHGIQWRQSSYSNESYNCVGRNLKRFKIRIFTRIKFKKCQETKLTSLNKIITENYWLYSEIPIKFKVKSGSPGKLAILVAGFVFLIRFNYLTKVFFLSRTSLPVRTSMHTVYNFTTPTECGKNIYLW